MVFRNYILQFSLLAALLFFTFTVRAQDSLSMPQPDTSKLRVGVAGSEPFVVSNNNELTGISVELWQSVALQAGWGYSTQKYKSVESALSDLIAGKLDVVVGPVSITSDRAKLVRFAQPYYQSSLSILSVSKAPTLWERISPLFSMKLLIAVFIFVFILACVGTLLWLAERKKNTEQFPMEPAKGIGNGMWCAIITMSTVGYGDIAPKTLRGRIVAGSWVVISIIFATSMVAGIASTLTLTSMNHTVITKAKDLNHKNIAVPAGSPAASFIKEYGGQAVTMDNIAQAVQLLNDKKADAVVFDRPQLLYYLNKYPEKDLNISHSEYEKQGYGFVFPLHTKLFHTANIYLLHDAETGKTERIINEWLGDESD
ncbi:MAG TPA: transporter substrate-binding domain-containing protein [Hanamia sp.]